MLYDPALPNARREAVSGLEDVRFKLDGNEDASETDLETLIRENEKLKEANEKLKNQFKLTPKDAVREADIARIARGILKEYNSQYSSKKLQEQMTRLYKYIRNSEDVDMNETARVAAEIGRGCAETVEQTRYCFRGAVPRPAGSDKKYKDRAVTGRQAGSGRSWWIQRFPEEVFWQNKAGGRWDICGQPIPGAEWTVPGAVLR